jgi:hypothetical protein
MQWNLYCTLVLVCRLAFTVLTYCQLGLEGPLSPLYTAACAAQPNVKKYIFL